MWQVTVSHCEPQPAVMSSASYTAICSWKQETLNPSLCLRKIWFHSDHIAGWPALQCCGVLDTRVLGSRGAAWCKRLSNVQKASKNYVLWVEGQNFSPFRCSSSAPFYCWQVPQVEVHLCLNYITWVHLGLLSIEKGNGIHSVSKEYISPPMAVFERSCAWQRN